MNKVIAKVWPPIAVLVDIVLLVDIATDLYAKYKAKKAEKNNVSPETEEEPIPEEA